MNCEQKKKMKEETSISILRVKSTRQDLVFERWTSSISSSFVDSFALCHPRGDEDSHKTRHQSAHLHSRFRPFPLDFDAL